MQDDERIDLQAPLSGDFQAVVRLIVGGIAERVDFAFEEIDDLQLAVERLLAEAGRRETVHLRFEVAEEAIRAQPQVDRWYFNPEKAAWDWLALEDRLIEELA